MKEIFIWGSEKANFDVDITDVVDQKIHALNAHVSQGLGADEPEQRLPEVRARALARRRRPLHRALPARRAVPLAVLRGRLRSGSVFAIDDRLRSHRSDCVASHDDPRVLPSAPGGASGIGVVVKWALTALAVVLAMRGRAHSQQTAVHAQAGHLRSHRRRARPARASRSSGEVGWTAGRDRHHRLRLRGRAAGRRVRRSVLQRAAGDRAARRHVELSRRHQQRRCSRSRCGGRGSSSCGRRAHRRRRSRRSCTPWTDARRSGRRRWPSFGSAPATVRDGAPDHRVVRCTLGDVRGGERRTASVGRRDATRASRTGAQP